MFSKLLFVLLVVAYATEFKSEFYEDDYDIYDYQFAKPGEEKHPEIDEGFPEADQKEEVEKGEEIVRNEIEEEEKKNEKIIEGEIKEEKKENEIVGEKNDQMERKKMGEKKNEKKIEGEIKEEKKEIERNEIVGEKDDQMERKKTGEKKNEKKINVENDKKSDSVQKIQPFVLVIIFLTSAMFFVCMVCACANCFHCSKCQCCKDKIDEVGTEAKRKSINTMSETEREMLEGARQRAKLRRVRVEEERLSRGGKRGGRGRKSVRWADSETSFDSIDTQTKKNEVPYKPKTLGI